ncbi:MAG TPA: hypothetical protein VGF86_09080 [Candidatus Tumulicola sp.]|jgi:hypothetical protein
MPTTLSHRAASRLGAIAIVLSIVALIAVLPRRYALVPGWFPAMHDNPDRPDWQPGMIDYLFLGFTTSTAFSPTEAMPLTRRAKLLMIVQSMVALITIAIVAARTINILK